MVYPSLGRMASKAASVHGRFRVLISRSNVVVADVTAVAAENKGVVIAEGVGAGVESHRDLLLVVVEVEVEVGARGVSSHV